MEKEKNGKTIKGFGKYYFHVDEEGVLPISRHRKKPLKVVSRGLITGRTYCMTNDRGHSKYVCEGLLAFLLRHPDINASLFPDRRKMSMRFTKDGTPVEYGDILLHKRTKSNVFRSLGDAFETIMVLMQVADKNESAVYAYAEAKKHAALYTVGNLIGTTAAVMETYWDDGVELFVKNAKVFNVEKIVPLYSMLCRSLKNAALSKRSKETQFNEVTAHRHRLNGL